MNIYIFLFYFVLLLKDLIFLIKSVRFNHNCCAITRGKCTALGKVGLFMLPFYSQTVQTCCTLLMDINHGLIILQKWNKMAHGVIT